MEAEVATMADPTPAEGADGVPQNDCGAAGVGMELSKEGGAVTVAALLEGGPAAASGMVHLGDELIRVDKQAPPLA